MSALGLIHGGGLSTLFFSRVVTVFAFSKFQELVTIPSPVSLTILILSLLACFRGRDASHTDMCILLVDCSTLYSVLLQKFHIIPDHMLFISATFQKWTAAVDIPWQLCMSPTVPCLIFFFFVVFLLTVLVSCSVLLCSIT